MTKPFFGRISIIRDGQFVELTEEQNKAIAQVEKKEVMRQKTKAGSSVFGKPKIPRGAKIRAIREIDYSHGIERT